MSNSALRYGVPLIVLLAIGTIWITTGANANQPTGPDMAAYRGKGGPFNSYQLPNLEDRASSQVRAEEMLTWVGRSYGEVYHALGTPSLMQPSTSNPTCMDCVWYSAVLADGLADETAPSAHAYAQFTIPVTEASVIRRVTVIGSGGHVLGDIPKPYLPVLTGPLP